MEGQSHKRREDEDEDEKEEREFKRVKQQYYHKKCPESMKVNNTHNDNEASLTPLYNN